MIDAAARAQAALLDQRDPSGHWTGWLSSSALSTATAVVALTLFARDRTQAGADVDGLDVLADRGRRWLADHQNADGGWGDTPDSLSNISTTTLCWVAFGAAMHDVDVAQGFSPAHRVGNQPLTDDEAVRRAERWIERAAGSLDPVRLSEALAARYGEDRTFSAPILTTCALTGRLGAEGWTLVPQLPFEIAALPHQLFSVLRLPVVSYALPALIAIGQVRHHAEPRAPRFAGAMRRLVASRTLAKLADVQPSSGGFLEAVPLTSFVVMSLVGMNRSDHPVVYRGIRFLVDAVRADGSWPIDTNLATWLTTLAVSALGGDPSLPDRERIVEWLLAQQYRREHPYTHAAPGGWAWTDLPGGVPDADDTAGALVALTHLDPASPRVVDAARAGIDWLIALQNADGGIPTFCRGWGTLPFDRSGADLTAHALQAWTLWRDRYAGGDMWRRPAALPSVVWRRALALPSLDRAIARAVRYLESTERADGAWTPLWFGNQHAPDEENPVYGTARVVDALAAVSGAHADLRGRVDPLVSRGAAWLLAAQNADGGWGGAAGTRSSLEETGVAVTALSAAAGHQPVRAALDRGGDYLVRTTDGGRVFPAAPIGLYFAKLWYSERLYPIIHTAGALRRLAAL